MRDLIRSKFKNQILRSGKEIVLEVRKYHRSVFYKNLWDTDPELVKSRGAVFVGGKQIVYPMDKCFNYSENGAGLDLNDDTPVVAYEKLNGYMLNLTLVDEMFWVVSTTGDAVVIGNESANEYLNMGQNYIVRFDGFAKYMELFRSLQVTHKDSLTLTFEVCHVDDPHIVPEEIGLHPICYQLDGTTYPLGTGTFTTVGELKESIKSCTKEGFMVYDLDGELKYKLKSPYYLAKKWVQRGGSKKVFSASYKERLDEEYYPIVERLRLMYTKDGWDSLSEYEKSNKFIEVLGDLREST